ncbi:MAG: amidohydrolase [Lacipirellulaceae bacterium]
MVATAYAAGPADLVVVNATVLTMDDERPEATALAVRDERFVLVGTDEEARRLVGPATEVVDASGRCVVPGFNDAHIHPGPMFDEDSPLGRVPCDPASTPDLESMIARLRRKALRTPTGQWVYGERYQDTKLGRHPTRDDLDRVSTTHPVWLTHSSGHVAAVNSYALDLAKVGPETADPPGGAFDRDAAGRPTGVLRESAKGVVSAAGPPSPEPTTAEWVEGMQRQFREYLRHGITSVQVAGTSPDSLRKYAAAQADERLVRLYVMLRVEHLDELSQIVEASGRGDDWLRVGAIKAFHGNSLSGQTCWLYDPYHERPGYYGIPPADSQAKLNERVLAIHRAGMQACIHSNGDREIDMVLDAYEVALRAEPRADHRHRIEHASVVNAAILDRVKRLGVVLAPHSYIWEHGDKMEAYGPQRWGWMHPNGAAMRLGIPVAGNSDSPVSAAIPLLRIQDMVTRTSAEGKTYGPEQRVTVEQAIYAWTAGSAYASFADDRVGKITPGLLADFVVLSEDPRRVAPGKIKDVQVELTAVGGDVLYDQKATHRHAAD